MANDTIRLEVPEADAEELTLPLQEAGIDYSAALSRQMTAETVLIGIVVPTTLTAVQIIAAYLIAKRQPKQPAQTIHVAVNRRVIKLAEFSVETVEAIIDRRLRDE